MTATLLLFLSLILSGFYIEATIVDFTSKPIGLGKVRFFLLIGLCVSWSALYYITR